MRQKEVICSPIDVDTPCECPLNSTYILFNHGGLEEIPKCMRKFKKARKIDFYSNEIREIKNLDGLVNLEELELGWNKIHQIKGLETLENLKKLYLEVNDITKMEGFDNLSNLEKLHLGSNGIRKLEGINHLKKLNELNLERNSINNILKKELVGLDSLEILVLSNNKIRNEDSIRNLRKLSVLKGLKNLNISGNAMAIISDLSSLENLERLIASRTYTNRITDLPIGLKVLKIEENNLKKIEKEITGLKQLEELSVGTNYIDEVEKIQKMKSLRILNLEDNAISNLENIMKMNWLNTLSIYGNDASIMKLSSLANFNKMENLFINKDDSGKKGFFGDYLKEKGRKNITIIPHPIHKNSENGLIYGLITKEWFLESRNTFLKDSDR